MTTHVAWVNPDPHWDDGIIRDLTSDDGYTHGKSIPLGEGGVAVIAGQHHVEDVPRIAEQITSLPWALVIVTSDEMALFPIDLLPQDAHHATWIQYHQREGAERVLPIGTRPGTESVLAEIERRNPARMGDVFFAGQNTHERREELIGAMRGMACDPKRYGNVTWIASSGFAQGLDQDRYLTGLRDARIAPCPSGPFSLDSFRLYEALAAGCLPVVETHTPNGPEPEFWDALFGWDHPLPVVDSWLELPAIVEKYRGDGEWHAKRNEIGDWWHHERSTIAADFEATIDELRV